MNFILSRNNNDESVYAIEHNGMEVYNPNYSECGRFAVNPVKHYGLDQKTVVALALLNSFFNYSTEV
jgi:N-acyl-L-homoserine lactone synthetase